MGVSHLSLTGGVATLTTAFRTVLISSPMARVASMVVEEVLEVVSITKGPIESQILQDFLDIGVEISQVKCIFESGHIGLGVGITKPTLNLFYKQVEISYPNPTRKVSRLPKPTSLTRLSDKNINIYNSNSSFFLKKSNFLV